jgi:hypothetical protein
MGSANHGRYLQEAMLAMRDPVFAGSADEERDAPVRALRLLEAMWGGSFAQRPDQKVALNDVGIWLETRVTREPAVKVDVLVTELGWLKRLAKHHQAMREDSGAGRAGFGAPGRGEQKNFGRRVADIERRRGEALAASKRAAEARPAAARVEVAKPKVAEPLPEVLAVEFEDFNKAREARKAAAEREKKKKEPKEALLSLVGKGGAAAGVKLVCSTTRTEGMAEVMDKVRLTAGAPEWQMVASGMVKEGEAAVFVGKLGVA